MMVSAVEGREGNHGHQRACSTLSRFMRLVAILMRTLGSAMSTSTIRVGILPAALTCLLTLVSAGGGSCADETPSLSPSRPVVADGELTLFLAGDAIITQPWSADRAPDFLALVDEIRGASRVTRRPTVAGPTWPRTRRSPPS
jgi:hypothetical protein